MNIIKLNKQKRLTCLETQADKEGDEAKNKFLLNRIFKVLLQFIFVLYFLVASNNYTLLFKQTEELDVLFFLPRHWRIYCGALISAPSPH